jgi:hypothetical protein
MNKFTVTRTAEGYHVVSDIFLSDHSYATMNAELVNNKLKRKGNANYGYSFYGYTFTVTLGPISLAKVQALSVGETVEL